MSVENILRVLDSATDDQRAEGMEWYGVAHSLALSQGDLHTGAGVIAALSPLLSWDRNAVLAAEAFEAGVASGCLGKNCVKANAILAGAEPLDVLGGDKVRSFYLNIIDPFDAEPVTVDRHAYDIAIGQRSADNERPNIKGKRYRTLAEEYRLAAAEAGMLPNQIQAITWQTWRERWAWHKTANVSVVKTLTPAK